MLEPALKSLINEIIEGFNRGDADPFCENFDVGKYQLGHNTRYGYNYTLTDYERDLSNFCEWVRKGKLKGSYYDPNDEIASGICEWHSTERVKIWIRTREDSSKHRLIFEKVKKDPTGSIKDPSNLEWKVVWIP
ncbi:MAG: hypothetical protein EU544_01340 [Promethearchaeota archaeon]|nr:MAG: hypothetical protein EU544_01340 [Candidatus Lokiarchaeota archaeon]